MSVPASSERFLAKARGLPVDEVMLDLEDSVAPDAKAAARELAVAALLAGGWDGKLVAVRVNDVTTPWAYQDVIAVTEGAQGAVDTLILPKVSDPGAVIWLDVLLGQLERSAGLAPGRIGIEAQIEDAAGLAAVEAIAASSSRLVSLVFGPADFMASIGMRSLTVGGQPEGYAFDAHHYPLMRILVAAKARGLQAIDGPYAKIGDADGLRAAATSAAALGYDGKWVLHPAQVDVVNDAFTPTRDDYTRALRILDAYERATSVDRRGAVMLDGEMIDEASRKLALAIAMKGKAAGLLSPGGTTPRTPRLPGARSLRSGPAGAASLSVPGWQELRGASAPRRHKLRGSPSRVRKTGATRQAMPAIAQCPGTVSPRLVTRARSVPGCECGAGMHG